MFRGFVFENDQISHCQRFAFVPGEASSSGYDKACEFRLEGRWSWYPRAHRLGPSVASPWPRTIRRPQPTSRRRQTPNAEGSEAGMTWWRVDQAYRHRARYAWCRL